MSYGSNTYGSTALGGSPALGMLFFHASEDLPAGTTFREAEYLGSATFFAIQLVMQATHDPPLHLMRIYSRNDPHETPQLQSVVGEAFFSETIIGAARFIGVEVELPEDLSTLDMQVTGREYFQ